MIKDVILGMIKDVYGLTENMNMIKNICRLTD